MRKIRLAALVLCLLAMCTAFAETEWDIRCWTTNDDAFYHMDQDCGEWEMYPISESAAIAFGKTACENCVIADTPEVFHDDSDIWLAVRSGTYVLCIPGASLDRIHDLEAVEAPESETISGDAVGEKLEGMLTEGGYEGMLRRFDTDGWALDSCRIPEMILDDGVLLMSARQIGEDWYFVFRPEKGLGTEAELKWEITEWEIRMENAGEAILTRSGKGAFSSRLSVESHADTGVVYEKDLGDAEITVYRRQGMNTAVIRDGSGDREKLAGFFALNGENIAQVSGYINNRKQATYCCIISDTELGGIVAGWKPEIIYR